MPRQACLTSVRFSMICDIVKPGMGNPSDPANWPPQQDPDSGAFISSSAPGSVGTTYATEVVRDVPLFAEAVLDGGIRVAGTTERFSDIYEAADWVKAVFPKTANITRRDRVVNIRSKDGTVLWTENEVPGNPPTEFNVQGVAPVIFMGKLVEYDVLLERAQVQ